MLRGDYMGLKVNRQTNLEKLFDQFAVIEPEKTEKNKKRLISLKRLNLKKKTKNNQKGISDDSFFTSKTLHLIKKHLKDEVQASYIPAVKPLG